MSRARRAARSAIVATAVLAAPGLAGAAPGAACEHRMPASTASAEALRHFQEGVVLAWGFDFGAAARAFREAIRRDPECALCQWGLAYALGPSINHDMKPGDEARALRAAKRAVALSAKATPVERGLARAIAARYAVKGGEAAARDQAYLQAMRELAHEHGGNPDVLVLAADAAMVAHPRDYWAADGSPRPWTPELLAWLERALALDPRHPGANHFWIHALEDSGSPARALEAAERIVSLCPGMGHLVHMASHVYFRVGRYRDAMLANQRAIEADRAAHGKDAAYVHGYARHNVHFLWAAALMQGAAAPAREAAAALAAQADERALAGPRGGTAQHFLALPLLTARRFGDWAAIRAAPRPPGSAPYALGLWHYAQGIAAAAGGDREGAEARRRDVARIARSAAARDGRVKGIHPHASLLSIAEHLLGAEIAAAAGDARAAAERARSAVALGDQLEHDEPPMDIAFAARQRLGALLLRAGNAAEAEAIYRADLARQPENGYALAGLAASLREQRREAEAAEAETKFKRAWAHADTPIERLPF